MARKINEALVAAIMARRPFKLSNTAFDPTTGKVTLHGNVIADCGHGSPRRTLAGWNTPTTRSRLNAIGDAFGLPYVRNKRGDPYVGDQLITDDFAWF